MNDFQRLKELVEKSDRHEWILDPEWVREELFAVKFLNGASGFIKLLETGKKYTNNNHSAIAYLIGVSDAAPTQPAVIFHTGRVDPPDVDMDFEDTRRDEVKTYLRKKWKHVAPIGTYNKFTSRNLVRDLSRVFGIPLPDVNRVCRAFNSVEEFETNEDTKWFRQKYPEILPLAKKFEGRWRTGGVHAAGMLVANQELNNILPLESRKSGDKERDMVVAFDMDDSQSLGLVKMDILGIAQLTVAHDCLRLIKERQGIDVDLDAIPLDDPEILSEYSKGHTVGVFQAEAAAYTNLLRKMGVDHFNDIVVSNGLVRPGPLLTVGRSYIDRKKGIEAIPKEHPAVEKITGETYNLFIFQEQLLQALVEIGKFTWTQADKVRKIIGKKRDAAEFKPYEDKWVTNASKTLGAVKAKKLWADFEKFAGYSFNKSHSAAYSLFSYQTMWLKTYYATEYIFALLKNEPAQEKVTTYLIEAQRVGIKILPPDINESEIAFTIDGESIRFGLSNIKGVGLEAAREILNARDKPFSSLEDLKNRTSRRKCNSKVINALHQVGALNPILSSEDVDKYDNSEFHYDLLGMPKEIRPSEEIGIDITPLSDYDADKVQIIRGIVKRIKKYPKYIRAEIEDGTSIAPLYIEGRMVDEGQLIIGLATGNALHEFIYENEYLHRLQNNYELSSFEKFLRGELLGDEQRLYNYGIGKIGDDKALVVPITVRIVKTKKDRLMAITMVSDGENVVKALAFPAQYAQFAAWIKPFSPVVIKTDTLDDGYAIRDLIQANKLLEMKESEP